MPNELGGLRNIGPTVSARLAEIGVETRAGLKKLGAPEVYRRLVARNGGRPLPVCYYLYSIQGALDGVHWDAIGDARKQELLLSVGRSVKRRRV
jgi:DNA transformation protein